MDELKDKIAVVTGGTRGLGFGIAQAYIRAGAHVVVASRSEESVENAVLALKEMGGEASGINCDVGLLEDVEGLARYTIKTFGKFDVWVNNAGLSPAYGPTIHIPHNQNEIVFRTNILGTYYGSLTAMVHFLERGDGKIINVSGRGDKGPVPLQNAYGSTKAWMRSFTLALAEEYKGSGVGIYLFKPGIVDTDMLRHVKVVEGYEKRVAALGKIIRMWGNEPNVPAEKAVWLASSATDGKTGLVVSVFSRGQMIKGLVNEGLGRLMKRDLDEVDIEITPVEPAVSFNGKK
jgi:NAD(P)-dependent dehydrogenase (short-subunit alcohol dehydrogenase family)